jgi:RNA polymerase sigma-54 factor
MLKQRLQQKLLQKLSPQQIQMIKLLEVPTLQIEQRIKKELEENPALEEGAEEEEFHRNRRRSVRGKDKDQEEFTLDDYIEEDDIPDYRFSQKTTARMKIKERDTLFSRIFIS